MFEKKELEKLNKYNIGRQLFQIQYAIEFEIGNHYKKKGEWSAFVRVKDPEKHPGIEKLISYVDFTYSHGWKQETKTERIKHSAAKISNFQN